MQEQELQFHQLSWHTYSDIVKEVSISYSMLRISLMNHFTYRNLHGRDIRYLCFCVMLRYHLKWPQVKVEFKHFFLPHTFILTSSEIRLYFAHVQCQIPPPPHWTSIDLRHRLEKSYEVWVHLE